MVLATKAAGVGAF